MNNSRTWNAKRNIFFGLINKFITLGLPFVIRTIIIYKLGVEYLGLSSLFSAILQVLNMAELGFSSAIIFNLYKPMAEEDTEKICALMALYRKIYRIIGGGILLVGIALTPFLTKLINGGYPRDINLYTLYLIYLINTSISYLFFGYKNVLLTATQRQDILNNIDTILILIRSVIQICLLCIASNYYLYIIWNPIITLANNLIVSYITNRRFPKYVCRGDLDKTEISSIVRLVEGSAIGKVGQVARNSFDSIILSAFLGLTEVAIYSNYYYILNAVAGIISIAIQSIMAGVGNSIATESVEKNYCDFKRFNFYYSWIVAWCTICLMCLYQPFMKMWVGEKLSASIITVILFCIYFFIGQIGQVRAVYATSSGIWWEFRYLQIGEMIGNLSLNFILGYFWGMNGIIIATIITVLIFSVIGIGKKTIEIYFKKSAKEYFMLLAVYATITTLVGIITYGLCSLVRGNTIFILVVRFVLCCVIPNILFAIIVYMNKEHRLYLSMFISMIKTKK